MSPGNIVGMSKLKGLDVIAITDHQRCGNIRAAMKFGEEFGVTVIPGMELETAEEIHFICLFPDLERALTFESVVKANMPSVLNREDIFGEEWLYDVNDEKMAKEPDLLLLPSTLPYLKAVETVRSLGGICYPAHVDRDSYSILSTFGVIPPELTARTLEISAECEQERFLAKHPELRGYRFIRSSDAHVLTAILEPGMMVEIAQYSMGENKISHIINALHRR